MRVFEQEVKMIQENFNKIIVESWKDEAFKEKLLTTPREILTEHGIHIPEGIEVEVVENTNSKIYFVLPHNPAMVGELPDGINTTVGACNTCGTSLPCATY